MNQPFYIDPARQLDIKLDLTSKPSSIDRSVVSTLLPSIATMYREYVDELKTQEEIWQPGGEWKNYNDEKAFLYKELYEGNLQKAEGILENFWRNKLGLIVKEYAKFEDLQANVQPTTDNFISSIARNYIIWKDLFGLPAQSLTLNAFVGNPWGCIIEGVFVSPKATRYHTNALQIKALTEGIEKPTIMEIGAGYGGLAYYLQQVLPSSTYVNIDLAETLVISAYYLSLNFPNKKIYLYHPGTFTPKVIEEYDIVLLPTYLIEKLPSDIAHLFFNSFSLSEMPKEANAKYIGEIARITKQGQYFLHNNMDRQGVVNRGFERIPASQYPMDPTLFKLISKHYDLFHAHIGDYKEFVYQVIK